VFKVWLYRLKLSVLV